MGWFIGIVVAIVTFPGAIMQTFAMRLVCDILKVDVYSIEYLSGQIVHGRLRSQHTAFAIASAPFLLNTLLCSVLTFPIAFATIHNSGAANEWPALASGYLGLCMGMHAFPDTQRMKDLLELADEPAGPIAKAFYATIRGIFWLARVLSVVWFDAIYMVAVACAVPLLVG